MLRLRRGNWECRQSPYLEFVNNVGGGRIIFKKAIDLLQKTRKIYAFLVCKNFDGHEVKLSRSTHFELDEADSVQDMDEQCAQKHGCRRAVLGN